MENASKALIIAGGVLLMILVLTFAIYMFNRIGNQTSEFYSKIEQSDIDEFNQKFLEYEDRKLSVQDVVSIINFVRNNNKKGHMPVKVIIESDNLGNDLQNKNNDELNNLLYNKIKSNSKPVYKLEIVSWNANSRLVEKIKINQNGEEDY